MWLQKVKEQVVNKYWKFVDALSVGRTYDYTPILDMINFLEIEDQTNNPEMLAEYLATR